MNDWVREMHRDLDARRRESDQFWADFRNTNRIVQAIDRSTDSRLRYESQEAYDRGYSAGYRAGYVARQEEQDELDD